MPTYTYPTAAGGTSFEDAVCSVFKENLLVEFYQESVIPACSNTDYEGDIKDKGSEVVITTMPDVDINPYYKGNDLDYQSLDPGQIILPINKGKSWSFQLTDVDKIQSHIPAWGEKVGGHAGRLMAASISQDFLADVYGDADASNQGATAGVQSGGFDLGVAGSPVTFNHETAVELVTAAGAILDEQEVPREGRFICLPSIFIQQMKNSDLKAAYLTGDSVSPLRNGIIGSVDNFNIIQTNGLAKTTDGSDTVFNCPFGWKGGITFASQVVKTEMLRNQRDFGDLMRGLQVYGWLVTKPEAVGWLYAKYAAPA